MSGRNLFIKALSNGTLHDLWSSSYVFNLGDPVLGGRCENMGRISIFLVGGNHGQ